MNFIFLKNCVEYDMILLNHKYFFLKKTCDVFYAQHFKT